MQTPLRCAFCQPEDARTSDDARVLVPWMHIMFKSMKIRFVRFVSLDVLKKNRSVWPLGQWL